MNIKPCDKRPILSPCTLENLNYQVDPYVGCGHYCYHCYVLNQAEIDWREEILMALYRNLIPDPRIHATLIMESRNR